MPNVQFEITVVTKATPADFPSATECLAAIGKAAEDVVRPYGGRVINVETKSREVVTGGGLDGRKAQQHTVTKHVVLVMKASGVVQS